MCKPENEELLSKIVELLRAEQDCDEMDVTRLRALPGIFMNLLGVMIEHSRMDIGAAREKIKDDLSRIKAKLKQQYPGIDPDRLMIKMKKIILELGRKLDLEKQAATQHENEARAIRKAITCLRME